MRKLNPENISELLECAHIEESKLFEMLLTALENEEKSVVIGASLLLGKLKDDRAEPFLIRAFLTSDQEIGSAVAWALGQCRSAMAIPFLSRAIEKGFASANSCEALGNIGDCLSLPILLNSLESQAEDVRMCAIKALGSLSEKCEIEERAKIIERLKPLSGDPSRRVRLCVGIVINRICDLEK